MVREKGRDRPGQRGVSRVGKPGERKVLATRQRNRVQAEAMESVAR